MKRKPSSVPQSVECLVQGGTRPVSLGSTLLWTDGASPKKQWCNEAGTRCREDRESPAFRRGEDVKVSITKGCCSMKKWWMLSICIPFVAGCGSASSNASAPTVHYEAAAVSRGQSIFYSTCAVCHGKDGQGNTGPALWGPNSAVQGFSQFSDLEQFIQGNMPQNNPGTLSSAQAVAVASYLWHQNHH